MQDPIRDINASVDCLAGQDRFALSDSELLCSVEGLLAVRNRLDGVLAARLQVIDTRCATDAEYGRKTRSWLIEDQLLAREQANRLMTVAKALPVRPTIEAALLAGDINLDHARNIAVSTREVDPDIQALFEKELVEAAQYVDPTSLGEAARELRSRLGAGETAEAAEQRKYDGRWVTFTSTFDGMHRLDGMLDPASAATLLTALVPLMRKTAEGDDRSVGQRRADALVTLADQAINTGQLPETGGEKPHLVCTMSHTQLLDDLAAAEAAGTITLNGLQVSPATARMLACDAGIIPAVLGSNSEVLDLGRKTSTWSVAQRRALNIEHPWCGWPGCQNPHGHAHHIEWWSRGGKTRTTTGVNLCVYHHYLVHHSNWIINKDRYGKIHVRRT